MKCQRIKAESEEEHFSRVDVEEKPCLVYPAPEVLQASEL